ncbi:MAG: S-layer homology domain-containing protein, partial [Thermoleophilia bacterium]|nr:S-layer homology domain-containing protein [Thermoleophilia bacterium]
MACSFSKSRASVVLGAAVLLLMVLLFSFVGPALAFIDVPPGHPYATAIADLVEKQVISGYGNGTFGPGNPTIRQQFAKMIVLSLGLPVSETDVCTFVDVDISGPSSLYPDNYIAVAAANAITQGTSPGHFSPDRRVTRAQAVTMAVRAIDRLKPGTLTPTPAGFQSTWGDFSVDHATLAAKAEANGLLADLGADASHPDGNLSALDPFGDMSRGEVAQLLHNLVGKLAPPPPPPTDYLAIHAPDAALSATYSLCAASSCHELNLFSQHVTKLGLPCTTCHASTRPEVVGAIASYQQTGTKQGCRVCHGQDAGQHAAAHELDNPVPSACTLCHTPNLISEHVTKHQLTCAVCHGPAATPAVAAVVASFGGANPLNPECASCHASAHLGLAAAHTENEAAECKDCHLLTLPDEHGRSSSSSKAAGCQNCHPLPGGFTSTKKCADCHEAGKIAPARHQAVDSAHAVSAACAGSSCHSSDLRTLHQGTAKGCNTCHSTSAVPTTTQCSSCHPSSPHVVREPYRASCANCHPIGGPGKQLHDKHVNEGFACTECHGASAPGCAHGSCHEHSVS